MRYAQLTYGQQYQIKALLDTGMSRSKIADSLGVHKSTISHEINRNSGKRGYRPKQAHEKSLARKRLRSKPRISKRVWRW